MERENKVNHVGIRVTDTVKAKLLKLCVKYGKNQSEIIERLITRAK